MWCNLNYLIMQCRPNTPPPTAPTTVLRLSFWVALGWESVHRWSPFGGAGDPYSGAPAAPPGGTDRAPISEAIVHNFRNKRSQILEQKGENALTRRCTFVTGILGMAKFIPPILRAQSEPKCGRNWCTIWAPVGPKFCKGCNRFYEKATPRFS